MRVLDRRMSEDGKTGRITVDEVPPDLKAGDVLVEPFPDLVFHEPPPEAEFFARFFGKGEPPVSPNEWPDELP